MAKRLRSICGPGSTSSRQKARGLGRSTILLSPVLTLFIGLGIALLVSCRDAVSAKIDALIDAYAQTDFFSGVVIISREGQPLYERAVGFADRAGNMPIRMTTRFNIASMGKTFTAVLIMQLVEQGRLDLHRPVSAYLPDIALPNADRITAHHLLTHTSGLSNYMLHPKYDERRRRLQSLDDAMALVVDMPLVFNEPGSRFEYSNSGFIVLGKIIERITGKSYLDVAREKIWGPLGMNRTSIGYPPSVQPPGDAIPYYAFSPRSFIDALADENPGFSDGGTFSTAPDLLAFARALAAGRLMKPTTQSVMLTPRAVMDSDTKYGYGWFIFENLYGRRFVGHSGGGHGYTSDLKIDLADGTIILVLANVRTPVRRITQNIIRLLATGGAESPKLSAAGYLFRCIEEKGIEPVLGHADRILAAGGYARLDGPSVLIGVADAFATLKKFDEALRVHARNARLFPSSPMPHDAMGEVYLSMGRREDALRSFEEALSVDPKDGYAAMRIKVLRQGRSPDP